MLAGSARREFLLDGLSGYAIEYSPFTGADLLVASARNFGISGHGTLSVIEQSPDSAMRVISSIDTPDCLFDCCWSEHQPNHVVAACGDGTVTIYDAPTRKVVMQWREHQREVFSCNWSTVDKSRLCSSSWDGTVRTYDVQSPLSLRQYQLNQPASGGGSLGCIYTAIYSPHNAAMLMATAGPFQAPQQPPMITMQYPSSDIVVMDTLRPGTQPAVIIPQAHMGAEVLSVDWNKYDSNVIASCGTAADLAVKVWDLRFVQVDMLHSPPQPTQVLVGHQMPARRVKWSPHHATVLATVSYDMTMRLWDTKRPPIDSCIHVDATHTEFVFGVDFNLFVPGEIATCAWDSRVVVRKVF